MPGKYLQSILDYMHFTSRVTSLVSNVPLVMGRFISSSPIALLPSLLTPAFRTSTLLPQPSLHPQHFIPPYPPNAPLPTNTPPLTCLSQSSPESLLLMLFFLCFFPALPFCPPLLPLPTEMEERLV